MYMQKKKPISSDFISLPVDLRVQSIFDALTQLKQGVSSLNDVL